MGKKTQIRKRGPKKTYLWKSGAVIKTKGLSPQIVGQELERIRAEHAGELTPTNVLDAACFPRSPLHKYFEWDDSKAAGQYRLTQARMLISSIAIRTTSGKEKKLYVSVRRGSTKTTSQMGGKGSVYVEREKAFKDVTLREQLRAKALYELRRWGERYSELRDDAEFGEFFAMLDAIDMSEAA